MGRPRKVTKENRSLETLPIVSGSQCGDGKPTIPMTQPKTTMIDESPETKEKKTPVKIDFSRSYATIIGSKNGARYEQDGKPFNVKGELIETD